MKFFVILTCLILERFFSIEKFLKREKIFQYYFEQITKLTPVEWQNSLYGLLLFLLPLEVAVGVLYLLMQYYFSWVSSFVIHVILLLYCLGPDNIYHIGAPIPQNLFEKIHRSLFSVLFWFALLGPFGASLYRLLERMAIIPDNAMSFPHIRPHIISIAHPLLGYLTWLPLRVFSAVQILVGKVPNAFNYWLDHLIVGWDKNETLAAEIGRISLGFTADAQLSSEHYIHTVQILDRILALFLTVMLIHSFISWVV
jgi:AmpE protein